MFLGTSSGAGKSFVCALACRHFSKKGMDAVPFKASNLSLLSHRTEDGGEIGVGQALQAVASGKKPEGRMNPILLRPSGKGSIDVRVLGSSVYRISPGCKPGAESLIGHALESFDALASRHDLVVCEGSGSPVELNLMDNDVANLRMARERGIPCVIVADIERGGAFAAVYGTWLLTPEKDRGLLKGFLINRFRGDPSILWDGIGKIETMTGMECLGIIPYVDVDLPAEDSPGGGGAFRMPDSGKYLKALDAVLDACGDSVDFARMEGIASGN